MNIHDYSTDGGKNLIKEYLSSLPPPLCLQGYAIRHKLLEDGMEALNYLNTRHIKRKLWEIKFSTERIFYILQDNENIFFAIERARQANLY